MSTAANDPRRALAHAGRLARIDVQRMRRKHTDWSDGFSAAVSVLVFALLLAVSTLGGGYLAYRAGGELAAAGTDAVSLGPFAAVEALRGVLAVFWLVITVIFLVRAVGQRGTLPQPEGVLTVVPTGQALVGVLLAEYAYFLLWLLPAGVSIGLGLAVGTGTAWPALTVPLAVAGAGVASVGVGYPLGLGIRHVVTRFAFVARNKGAILLLVFVAYFLALTSGAIDQLLVRLFEPMQASPVGWYGDLLVAGLPGFPLEPLRVAGAVALTAVLAAAAVLVGTRIAAVHWFSDSALAGETPEPSEGDASPGLDRRLAPVFGVASASLVALTWRRARRSPLKLLYALYPFLILAGLFADIVQSGEVPAYLPFAILLFVAWGAGVVFTLNPLGEQGATLSATLLSKVDGRTFVRSHLLASLLVAVPLGLVATAVVAWLSPVETETAVLVVAATPLVMLVSATLSVGIGMAFPRFEATSVTRSMKTVLPSRWAFVLFTVHLFATAAAAVLVYEPVARNLGAGLLSWLLPFGLSVSADGLFWVAAVALVPLVLAPVPAYRYAVRRFDGYTIA